MEVLENYEKQKNNLQNQISQLHEYTKGNVDKITKSIEIIQPSKEEANYENSMQMISQIKSVFQTIEILSQIQIENPFEIREI